MMFCLAPGRMRDDMGKRIVSIFFRHLKTDWFSLRSAHRRDIPFILRGSSHGRMVITDTNWMAEKNGISPGMVLADARAIMPDLEVDDDMPGLAGRLLERLATWCIRFTPVAAMDPPDGLLLDATGCTHLWGGDSSYVKAIGRKLRARGYDVRIAMADTAGVAWAQARFGPDPLVIAEGRHIEALMGLPPEAIRLAPDVVLRLHKLGLHHISQLIGMPRASFRRRFGPEALLQLDRAVGREVEVLLPVVPMEPYQERLPCMEPIISITGIEIALNRLLKALCFRLQQEHKGLRKAVFKCYRVDGRIELLHIATHRPSSNVSHLFKLFEVKLSNIEPALGIELFVLELPSVEDCFTSQEKLWEGSGGLEDIRLSELVDSLAVRIGVRGIHRYLPDEHYWPERSLRPASSLTEKRTAPWNGDRLRPVNLLPFPERIEVTAPIPDYPPMLFRYGKKLHKIIKADGPERIEQEWWVQQGQHRDYYRVEDEEGNRFWIFRLGHYHDEIFRWFLHGFFA